MMIEYKIYLLEDDFPSSNSAPYETLRPSFRTPSFCSTLRFLHVALSPPELINRLFIINDIQLQRKSVLTFAFFSSVQIHTYKEINGIR